MDQQATHIFDAPIDKVWAMFTDPEAHVAKFAAMGHREVELLGSERTDDTFTVEITRLVDVDLPGFARKVLKPTNTVTSRDEWRDKGDGTYEGDWVLETVGAPVKIKGTTKLTPQGDKTHYELTAHLKVTVPLIGGRIENWAKGDMEKQIQQEFEAGDTWLREHA